MTDQEQQALNDFRQTVDTSQFSNQPYARRVEKPWGWEIHFVPDGFPYMGKLIHIDAGKQVSLQLHDEKRESWLKLSGDAMVILEDANGQLQEIVLEDGKGYTAQLGQKHRLKAGGTDVEFLEVSTPEKGNTYRLEDDYQRDTETEAARDERNTQASFL